MCEIEQSVWQNNGSALVYHVKANRFLRGMIRGLVGTMLKLGRGLITVDEFRDIIETKDCTKADFTTPPQGLFLAAVFYPQELGSFLQVKG